jgi:hypothetical protein
MGLGTAIRKNLFRGQKGTGSRIWISNTPKQKTSNGARSKRYRIPYPLTGVWYAKNNYQQCLQ